jgi:hypothetical protein
MRGQAAGYDGTGAGAGDDAWQDLLFLQFADDADVE